MSDVMAGRVPAGGGFVAVSNNNLQSLPVSTL